MNGQCPTPDCEGDTRYAAPGRRHRDDCAYPNADRPYVCTCTAEPDECRVHGLLRAYPPDRCDKCRHPFHGLPCIRHNSGTPCGCETAWEATA